MRRWRSGAALVLVVLAASAAACATKRPPVATSPVAWRQPDVPPDLASQADNVARYESAWQRIRAGNTGGGERDLSSLWKQAANFYPAAASLGELRLQRQQYREAAAFYEAALAANPRYVPALAGVVDARLGAGDDRAALKALQALLAVEPGRDDARARLDAVRLRVAQSELSEAGRLRAAGQFDEAETHLLQALEATPENGPVLRELARVALGKGVLDLAESRARQALALDPQDGASLAVLGDVLEGQGRFVDAAASYARAVALDPRPAWRDRLATLQVKAQTSALPDAYRQIESAARVTRAQVAAVLGVRLAAVLARAPARVTAVVTDVRGHWASMWILPVVRAGWMDAMPNHTFQPSGTVNRGDLARIVAAVLADAGGPRARAEAESGGGPAFADLPRDHAAYRAAALAVSAGIMTTVAQDRFQPAAAVSGSELLATIARLEARAK